MKTKEFIKEVEELGYKITGTKYDMFINSRGAILVTVSKKISRSILATWNWLG